MARPRKATHGARSSGGKRQKGLSLYPLSFTEALDRLLAFRPKMKEAKKRK